MKNGHLDMAPAAFTAIGHCVSANCPRRRFREFIPDSLAIIRVMTESACISRLNISVGIPSAALGRIAVDLKRVEQVGVGIHGSMVTDSDCGGIGEWEMGNGGQLRHRKGIEARHAIGGVTMAFEQVDLPIEKSNCVPALVTGIHY